MRDRIFLFLSLTIAAIGLVLFGTAGSALAHHCKGQHANDPGCSGGDSGGNGTGNTLVQVTLADLGADTLVSDGGGPYIDGVEYITAEITDLRFHVLPENKSPRTITIDFGTLVDCGAGALDCITDAVSGDPITCPIVADNRVDSTLCKGPRKIWLNFRDVFVDQTTIVTLRSMPADGVQYPGQDSHHEVQLMSAKNEKNGWGLIFKENPGLTACGHVAENLGITAFNATNDGGVPESWEISTDTVDGPTKIACLAKASANSVTFEGYVEMQFSYVIERLP